MQNRSFTLLNKGILVQPLLDVTFMTLCLNHTPTASIVAAQHNVQHSCGWKTPQLCQMAGNHSNHKHSYLACLNYLTF